jgi:hypothetical protein
LRTGIAVLKVGAAGATNEQGIACERAILHQVAIGVVGVPGRIERVERDTLDFDLVASATRIDTTSALVCSPMTVTR